MSNPDYCKLDNESFSVELTANEWACIAQMLEGFLSTNRLEIIVSAHEKIKQAAKSFVELQKL